VISTASKNECNEQENAKVTFGAMFYGEHRCYPSKTTPFIVAKFETIASPAVWEPGGEHPTLVGVFYFLALQGHKT
jgi:hypothetical protein